MDHAKHIARFESFNAKYLPPSEVAKSFIPPLQWPALIENGHTLLIGPRGAGKTTLLKMLTSGGIMNWNHADSDGARNSVAFVGVFVTADRNWSEQINALGSALFPEDHSALGLAMFATHVLHALVETAADRIHSSNQLYPADIDAQTEADIAAECASAWGISRPIATLRGLQHALTDRIAEIADLAERAPASLTSHGEESSVLERFPSGGFVHHSLQLIERFNTAANEPRRLWCFLFDELELAPSTVIQRLIRGLRGGDERLLFKLSLAPYTDGASLFRSALAAQQAHDFQIEHLTYPHQHEPIDFCRALLEQQLGEPLQAGDDITLLGKLIFAPERTELGFDETAYDIDSRQVRTMAKLAEEDQTFAAWLADHEIDLSRLHEVEPRKRASTVRKVSTLALLRQEYRNPDDSFARTGRRRRGRKTYAMFGGIPALYAMVEGNPRWFMNLIRPLAEEKLRRSRQGQHIREVVRLFRAILTAMPLPPSEAMKRELGALPVLDAIGRRLSEIVIDDDFNSDPPGKFRIDDAISDEVVTDLAFALNVGGIIHMPDKDHGGDIIEDLRGQTFRLAHLLAPWYPIPLTTGGRTVNLSTLLQGQDPSWQLSRQLELEDVESASEANSAREVD